ncbi:protein FAM71A [Nannospalax galili]|uniref:protein FAM71A n=1 Tax=Nannospalax galili TaxID=1026970 RepID=UPI0004ECFFBE|nr:protein FAM71A [Nannospalax galili]
MKMESLLPYFTAQGSSRVGMFNTAMGRLQRQLYKGEYDIFKYAPIFESDFIQITKRGEVIDVHNRVRMVTLGIACTSPVLPLPDVMLLARPVPGCENIAGCGQATKGRNRKAAKTLELTRLLPLKFMRISVHNCEKQQLRLKFATGRSCYLQLCPPQEAQDNLFTYWEKLIYLLRPPVDSNSSTYAIPAEDMMYMPMLDEETKTSLAAADAQGKGDPDQVSIRSLHLVTDVSGVTSAAFVGGEGSHHDSQKSNIMPSGSITKTRPKDLAKELPTGTRVVTGAGSKAGTLSLVAPRSLGSGQINTAGGVAMGAKGSKSQVTIASAGKTSPRSIQAALAGAMSKSLEYISSASTSLSQKDSRSVVAARAEATSRSVRKAANDPAALALTLTLPSESHSDGQNGKQRASEASAGAHKDKRERKERREKERAAGRSSHNPKAEGLRKAAADKADRKSPSHRAAQDAKEKGSHKDTKHGSGHKGISHVPITKELRNSHKSRRNFSNTSSASTNKRLSRISSFLRNIRVNLAARGLASQQGCNVDIMAKKLERTDMEAVIDTGPNGQDLDIIGSVTSEVTESVTFEAH